LQIHDLVLQHRRRQPAVDHHEAGFALHWGLGQRVCQRQQLAHLDDAAAAGLQSDRPHQVGGAACAAAQRGVQCGQCARPSQRPGHFDGRPRGSRRRAAAHQFQRRTITTVHDQAVGRPQLPALGIENMQFRSSFGVEAV
jgi:hypothetical protein